MTEKVYQSVDSARLAAPVVANGVQTTTVQQTIVAQSPRQEMSPYQQLKAKKLAERELESQNVRFSDNYGTPVNSGRGNVNSIGFGYSSVVPQ